MTTKQFIPYARQEIGEDDIKAAADALRGSQITRGSHVQAFEDAIKDYVDAPFAVAFNSGSSALNAAAYALDIGSRDRVISTPNTFVATVGSAVQRGAIPVFIDTDPTTGFWDNELALSGLEPERSRGKDILIPVHYTGSTVDISHLNDHLNLNSYIIEDAAQALGSTYPDGTKVGSSHCSEMTIFSFHPAKTITTGEGGMVTTRSEELYQRLLLARNNGISATNSEYPGFYEVVDLSCNYNMTDFQAALGLNQLKKIDQLLAKRRELVASYRQKLQGLKHVSMLLPSQDAHSAHNLFVVLIDFKALNRTRKKVMEDLHSRGIGTQVHYIPLYRHPVFKNKLGDLSEFLPNSELYFSKALTLPLHTNLQEEDIHYIVSSLKEVLGS